MKYIKSIVSNSIYFKELENSVLFILDDGFKFFHPLSMTNFICNNIEITYTDEWKFTLRKSEKVDGKWVDIETKEVKGSDIEFYIGAISLMHIPPTLEPLDDVEVPTELLDE